MTRNVCATRNVAHPHQYSFIVMVTLLSIALLAPAHLAEAGQLIGVIGDGQGNGLVAIDASDASSVILSPLGNGDDGEGIAYRPDDGLLYHVSGISDGFEFFETINPSTSYTVGPNLVPGDTYGPDAAQELSAFAWHQPLGVFLAMDRDANWYHITPGGAFSDVGDYNGAGEFDYMRGLAVVGSRVYSISPDSDDDFIEELDPATGQVLNTIIFTVDGNPGAGGTALAYDSETDTIYGAVRLNDTAGSVRHLASLDLNTGDFTSIGALPNGIAGLTVIPEPATALLLLGCLLAPVSRRSLRERC